MQQEERVVPTVENPVVTIRAIHSEPKDQGFARYDVEYWLYIVVDDGNRAVVGRTASTVIRLEKPTLRSARLAANVIERAVEEKLESLDLVHAMLTFRDIVLDMATQDAEPVEVIQ